MLEYDAFPELLALKAIVLFLLSEKISEYKDENAAHFEISKICSETIDAAVIRTPDPERTKQNALRVLDDLFLGLKPRGI